MSKPDQNGDLTCLFCGQRFKPHEILFVYDDESQTLYEDKIRHDFLEKFDEYYPPETFPELYYLIDPSRNYCEMHGETKIPEKLWVQEDRWLRKDGFKPNDLPHDVNEETGEWAWRRSSISQESETGDGDALNQPDRSLCDLELTDRACPHCHCRLPNDFGLIEVKRAVMVGGVGAGKTTFIINALDQLNYQLGYNQLGFFEWLPESKHYFEKLSDQYKRTRGLFTGTKITPLFPLYFYFRANRHAGNKQCLVGIYDIAGEGFDGRHNAWVKRHSGIKNANTLLVLLDPHQLHQGLFDKLDPNAEIDPEYGLPRACEDNLHQALNRTMGMISSGRDYKDVVIVLTKIDLPLTYDADLFGRNSILRTNIGEVHHEKLNKAAIVQIDQEIQAYLDEKCKEMGIHSISVESIFQSYFPDDKRPTSIKLAVSTRTMNADGVFENQYLDGYSRHRIVEPLLFMLYRWGYIALSDSAPPQSAHQSGPQSRPPSSAPTLPTQNGNAARREPPPKSGEKKRRRPLFG